MDEAKQLFFKLFLLNAQKGEASSQYQVGYWYLNGLYTEKRFGRSRILDSKSG
jgi:TPR repeat protein